MGHICFRKELSVQSEEGTAQGQERRQKQEAAYPERMAGRPGPRVLTEMSGWPRE